jgi:DNA-binding NarL/FixJ family response regulator
MRLLIADGHALTRAGIRLALERRRDGLTVVGEAATGLEVLPLIRRHQADVVLLDRDLPGIDSLTTLERLRARHPQVAVVMLGADANPAQLQAAFARGAQGWIVKTIDPGELGTAIAHSVESEVFVPYGPIDSDGATARRTGITERELEIIRFLGRGYTNKQIAGELWITVQTVKFHLTNVYRKLSLPNRTAVARWAHESGLLGTTRGAPTSDTRATAA